MRFHVTVLLVLLLSLGPVGAVRAATEASEATTGPPAAGASEVSTGRLRFVHAADGAPALGIDLHEPQGSLIGMWRVEPGSTTDLVPDVPLVPGTYEMTILPPTGGGTSGTGEIATFAVPVAAGSTTVVTAYADQHGRLLFVLDTPEGTSTVRPLFQGTLVVEHDVEGGPAVDVVVWVLQRPDAAFEMGRLVPGGVLDDELEAGPHTLLLYADGAEVGRAGIFVVDDQTTTVLVSDVLGSVDGGQTPVSPPAATFTPSAAPSDFPRPERIDTGGGGGVAWVPWLVGAVAVGAAVVGAVVAARLRGSRSG